MILDNQSSFQVSLIPSVSQKGLEQNTLVIKVCYRFSMDGELVPTDGDEISLLESFYGDPSCSSIETTYEGAPFKEGFEVLIQGKCFPEKHQNALFLTASLSESSTGSSRLFWQKSVNVFGERHIKNTVFGKTSTRPELLGEFDLKWENSFGGRCVAPNNKRFDHNPVGVGWKPKKTGVNRLPNILNESISSLPRRSERATGFAPIASQWAPRLALYEQYSKALLDVNSSLPEAYCVAPSNLYNCAPLDQQFKKTPIFPCQLILENWYREAPNLELMIKEAEMSLWHMPHFQRPKKLIPKCDTLLVNTTKQEVTLLYRIGLEKSERDHDSDVILVE
ncbi:DUF2169 domain-containing protein [Marinomonas balearica]|uniref:Uncharacterized protein DUF2169 n=1 Tax=Marinomonas balearica TaxID=491947 RepID=A0A4R6M383_9GAMM|nr:DUF2169 domain-containing protein [Marinomonas balearica]TDO95727.1 uncharacterized protein DUF2169 [Marinomonas balearica]